MAKHELCVFCGQKPGMFRRGTVSCGSTEQTACDACARELEGIGELERCQRALVRGLAENPERVRERIELIGEAENRRPKCVHCGTGLTFMPTQCLDNSPLRDGIFSETFDVIPAFCESCGKYEFYKPAVLKKNRYLQYLAFKDTNGYI